LIAALLGGLAAGWAAQLWLVLRQTRRFNARLRTLRAQGTTAVGRGGSRRRGFVYVALSAKGARVVAAESMSGMTVFARLRPAADLVGRSLSDLAGNHSSRRASAAAQAAEAILTAEDANVAGSSTNRVAATSAAR
jgi:DNA-binding transcriptional regulator of glucitol operon